MSDSESARSASPSRQLAVLGAHDEVFHDHRNQPAHLPVRSGPVAVDVPEEAVVTEEDPLPPPRHTYMSDLRKDFYLNQHEDDEGPPFSVLIAEPSSSVPLARGSIPLAGTPKRNRHLLRSQSFSERLSAATDVPAGILRVKKPDDLRTQLPMAKVKTNDSAVLETPYNKRERRASRSSIDLEADLHASRSLQETEEDVCFPMLREHVRVKGIDFDEIEEFIKAEREEEELMRQQQQLIAEKTAFRVNTRDARGASTSNSSVRYPSNTALKYTPKNILSDARSTFSRVKSRSLGDNVSVDPRKPEKGNSDSSTMNEDLEDKETPPRPDYGADVSDDASENVRFGATRVSDNALSLPDRFSFFSSESEETVHAPDIPSLLESGQTVSELFRGGESTWWLDCICPTDAEMKMLAKAFGIHPLTAEDIRMQETREKVELFKSYYFVCFHTFEPDKESEDYLEPINVYVVVFRDGILTFHFLPLAHPANVRRRVRQLRDYVDVSADWLCYAIIDDITDGFAPVITGIEYEADAIEDSVFVARELDFSNMLQRIGESRRKVMTLMRLLSGKADVIKMFAKRCQDEAAVHHHHFQMAQSPPGQSHVNLSGLGSGAMNFGPGPGANPALLHQQVNYAGRAQPRADIALYLGDIQDHVVTMFQNLSAYEKIFSRSHANYLAQLQVESFNSNNKLTKMFSKVTLIGTMLVPLNLVTGLFGMNVNVPGQGDTNPGLKWFFGIFAVIVFIIVSLFVFAKYWLARLDQPAGTQQPFSARRSIKSLGLKTRRDNAKSILSFPNKYE